MDARLLGITIDIDASDWEYSPIDDGWICCPMCCESMLPDRAGAISEHSPDCHLIMTRLIEAALLAHEHGYIVDPKLLM